MFRLQPNEIKSISTSKLLISHIFNPPYVLQLFNLVIIIKQNKNNFPKLVHNLNVIAQSHTHTHTVVTSSAEGHLTAGAEETCMTQRNIGQDEAHVIHAARVCSFRILHISLEFLFVFVLLCFVVVYQRDRCAIELCM